MHSNSQIKAWIDDEIQRHKITPLKTFIQLLSFSKFAYKSGAGAAPSCPSHKMIIVSGGFNNAELELQISMCNWKHQFKAQQPFWNRHFGSV